MRASVVVPAVNEAQGLAASLRSIRQAMKVLDTARWSSELIVCDNNSTDRTAAIAREEGAQVVFEPINQISRARNTGAASATGDWLIFVDADSHPSRGLFADVLRAIENGRCIAGGSTFRFDAPDRAIAFVAWSWNTISRLMRWAAGSFMFCEAATFREAGGFNQELYAAEEIDLFRRLYTWRETLRFIWRTVVQRGRTLRSVEECFSWYDGRR